MSLAKFIFLILAAALLAGCSKPAEPVQHPPRWEYKVLEFPNYDDRYDPQLIQTNYERYQLEKRMPGEFGLEQVPDTNFPTDNLRQLGQQGWELVAAVPEIETIEDAGGHQGFHNVRTSKLDLIFKRPVP